jgi:hypothetical protein
MMGGVDEGELRLRDCTDEQMLAEVDTGNVHARVTRLCVAESRVTDACLAVLPKLYPNLEEIHAQKTLITGKGLDVLMSSLPRLRMINLDQAAVTPECASALLRAFKARPAGRGAPVVAVSILGIGELDTKWSKLLEIACNGRVASSFRVRTDLQKPLGQRPCHAVQIHDTVDVHVHLDGHPPFEMLHLGVPASRPIMYVAKDAITELNLIASGDVKVVAEPSVAGRRAKYRTAFEKLYMDGFFFSKTFRNEHVWLETIDILAGTTTTTDDVQNKLLGPVQHRLRTTVHVRPTTVSNLECVP